MRWNTQTIIKYLKQDSLAKYIEAGGKLTLGVAAIVAATQTGTVLDEVGKVKDTLTEIQSISTEIKGSNQRLENISERIDKTSSQIEKSNGRLESSSQEIITLINGIRNDIGLRRASGLISSPEFEKNASPENFDSLLKKEFSKPDQFGIYLGDKERNELVKAYKGGDLEKRELALGIAQKLSSSFLDHPSGVKIRTSD